MRYEEPASITEGQLETVMASDNIEAKYRALIRASLHIPGSGALHRLIADCLVAAAVAPDAASLAEAALTASSHIARLGHMDEPRVYLDLIAPLLRHPHLGEHAAVMQDDIRIFAR